MVSKQSYGSISEIKTTRSIRDDDEDEKDHAASKRMHGRSATLLAMVLIGFVFVMLQASNSNSNSNSTSNFALEASLDSAPASVSFLLDDALDEKALYYEDQTVDHLRAYDENNNNNNRTTYRQRYYKRSSFFMGPGHPILVIMGGEAALEPPMLYPFVNQGLASEFGAFVVSPEHRFYGTSQPVDDGFPTVPEMMAYLSPDQALEDAVRLIEYVRAELGCDPDKTHPGYCPVITVSYSIVQYSTSIVQYSTVQYFEHGSIHYTTQYNTIQPVAGRNCPFQSNLMAFSCGFFF